VGSHAFALRKQGVDQDIVDAIGTGDLSKVTLTPKDQALLRFVKLLTLNPAHTLDIDVQAMRDAGWTDEQIWETALEVGIFSFLNRMSDAYGLDYPSTGWYPPQMREKMEREKEKGTGSSASSGK
jgi:alkylhydroperoxidase family enzyme